MYLSNRQNIVDFLKSKQKEKFIQVKETIKKDGCFLYRGFRCKKSSDGMNYYRDSFFVKYDLMNDFYHQHELNKFVENS